MNSDGTVIIIQFDEKGAEIKCRETMTALYKMGDAMNAVRTLGVQMARWQFEQNKMALHAAAELVKICRSANVAQVNWNIDIAGELRVAREKLAVFEGPRLTSAGSTIKALQLKCESLEREITALRSGITGQGYNSPRETLALMAEGEGDNVDVYRNMARGALFKLDAAIQDADIIRNDRGEVPK